MTLPSPSLLAKITVTDPLTLAGTRDPKATFGEHEELKVILLVGNTQFEIQTACEVHTRRVPFPVFPVFTASLDSSDPQASAVGVFGGIHGLERIGTQVILYCTRALLFRLKWDELLPQQLQKGAPCVYAHRQPWRHVGAQAGQPERC